MVIATLDGKKMVLRRVARPPPRPPGIHSTYSPSGRAMRGPSREGCLGRQTHYKETTGTLSLSLSPNSGKQNIHPMRVPGDLRSPFEQLSTNKQIESPHRFIAPKGLRKNVRSNRVWYSTDESWILLFARVKSIYLSDMYRPLSDPNPIPPSF